MSGVEFVPELEPTSYQDGFPGSPPPPPAQPPLADGDPPLSGPRRVPRLLRGSLVTRLVSGVVTLVVLLVIGIGGGTYYALRSFLNQRLHQQLRSAADGDLRTLFGSNDEYNGYPTTVVRPPQGVWAVGLGPDGSFLAYSRQPSVRHMRLSTTDRTMIAHGNTGDVFTVETTDGQQLVVTTRPANAQQGVQLLPAIAVIGLSTDDEQKTLHRLLGGELVLGGIAVAVAIVATYGGVRFGLRGLRRVTSTAQEVAAELSPSGAALQRRVPVTEDGTEIAQLTEAFNTLLAATETQFAYRVASEERMRQFLADASHELRTPLTSIRGYAELARMQRAVGQADADNLDRIEAEGTRMSRLVEDLLLLARGDAAGTPAQSVPVDVGQLLGDAVSGARAAFPDRDFQIDAMQPLRLLGDPDQLVRVVRNLLTNAAVHTRPGPPIRVRAVPEAGGVTLQVVDGGPGLPPEEAAHVFERFWRADKARTRSRGGSGLGLAIVATIVAAHGGSVRFDSSVEAGTTVSVWLPAAP